MLFNSPAFLFLFLPVCFGLFLFLKIRRYGHWALSLIGISSLVFYAFWDIRYLVLLLTSITFNFIFDSALTQRPDKRVLITGLAGNLLCLGWFKYAGFFASSLNEILPHKISKR